ncbi:MAG: DnaB-like helicase C-terminal domain-containing protein, partial [Clostridia bacterium]
MSREKSGKLSPQDYNNLFIAGQVLSKLKIYGNESAGVKPADILSQCRRLKSHEDLDLIVIDYIQLMKGDEQTAESRQVEVSNITRSLKIIAKELKVPVLALSQLKRDVETRKEGGGAPNQPMLSDLRESGSIEQDADIVMFLNPHKADATEPNIFPVDLMVAKHRNGQTPTIPLTWLGPIVRFVESDGRSMEIEKKVREQLGQAPVVSETAVVIETPTYVDAPEEVGEEPLNTSDAHNIEE